MCPLRRDLIKKYISDLILNVSLVYVLSGSSETAVTGFATWPCGFQMSYSILISGLNIYIVLSGVTL